MPDYWYPTAFSYWGDEEEAAMQGVIASGRFTMGAQVEAFEREFADYHGVAHGVMVNSGSSANLVAVSALSAFDQHIGRWTKVAVPAIAWATTYAPLVQLGFQLVVCDVDDTWCARSYDGDVRLEICCSVLGNPDYLSEKASKPRYVIEDNCESLGAEIDGKKCGTFGTLNTFSFFYSHQLSAIEGGMILTNNEPLARFCRMIRDHGMTRSVGPINGFDQEYDFRLMGYNVRPLEMHAAVAREQLKKLDDFVFARRTNEMYFWGLAGGLPLIRQTERGFKSPFGIAFRVENKEVRWRLASAFRLNGIDCRLPTGGSFLRHQYGSAYAREFSTPNADRIHDTGMFIGNAPYPIPRQIEKAVAIIEQVV